MAKKKRIVMIGGLMVTVIIIIAGVFYYFTREANIMEQIYKAARAGSFKTFNEVSALQGVSYEDLAEFENFGGLSIPFQQFIYPRPVKMPADAGQCSGSAIKNTALHDLPPPLQLKGNITHIIS